MNISSVSFTGKKEIYDLAERYMPLTKEENFIKNSACDVHDVKVSNFQGQPYCSREGEMVVENYIDMLDRIGRSRFSYLVAMDTFSSDVVKSGINGYDKKLAEATLKIAADTPSVTKFDILNNLDLYSQKLNTEA